MWGPPVTVLETLSGTPYYFSFHVRDLGNSIVIGPSGTGKTVAMAFLLAQARRLSPRILFFDKDRGADVFIRAVGGVYCATLRSGTATHFNPFQLADSGSSRAFLTVLLRAMLAVHGESLTAEDDHCIARAVEHAFQMPMADRQLSTLAAFFPRATSTGLEARLRPWCGSGDLAWLFDHAEDRLRLDAPVMGFDLTESCSSHPRARVPALLYLFHRADQALDGNPTILCVDEGWKALADPAFSPMIEDWQRTIRKRNGIVIFGSQSASSVLAAPMGRVIIEQSPTQLFLPNSKADRDSYVGGFHLSEREYQLIRSLPADSHAFLLKQGTQSTASPVWTLRRWRTTSRSSPGAPKPYDWRMRSATSTAMTPASGCLSFTCGDEAYEAIPSACAADALGMRLDHGSALRGRGSRVRCDQLRGGGTDA